ncbi:MULTISPECIES: hypothetical protein [Haloarcula]|uniref:hypothetical protein n=1 Tax=Haloarcula TaxID=2237 RepID=UPI0023E7F2A8|nr:hypothetical protein [Halomicroarcula sp. SHR3]
MTRADGPSRRRFLLGTGIAIGTTGLAGCGIPGGGGGDEEEEDGGGGEEGGGEGGEEEEEELLQPSEE